jgi:tetratricopeptide (TPR) repeat protein
VKLGFVLIALLLCCTAVAAQVQNNWISETERAHFESLRQSGVEALYNLDYEKARKEFSEIARLYPDHPAGSHLLAAGIWIRNLYQSRRLQASLYNSESFYTKGDDKVDPKIIEEFRLLTRQAKQLSQARLKKNAKDIEALDFLASTEGLKAAFEEAVERRHLAALRDGSDAVDHHREVLKLDPNFIDAGITVGLYDYVVGSLPLPIKLMAGVAGFRGSKKRGLAMLERVAKEGKWSRDDAKTLLIVLYSRERRYAEAVTVARDLSSKYPRNYLFRLEMADALVAQAAVDRKAGNADAATKGEREAFATFEELLRDRNQKPLSQALDLIHFKYGEVLFIAGQDDRAAREFLAVTKIERAEPTLVTMAYLYAARAFDVAGRREEALAQYKQVLTRPDIYDAHDEARKGLRQPYKPASGA